MAYAFELLKLVLVVAGLAWGAYAIAKKMKKRQLSQISPNGIIKILDGVNIGMNQALYVVRIGEETIAVTTGANGVSMLNMEKFEIKKAFEQEKFEALMGESAQAPYPKGIARFLEAAKGRRAK